MQTFGDCCHSVDLNTCHYLIVRNWNTKGVWWANETLHLIDRCIQSWEKLFKAASCKLVVPRWLSSEEWQHGGLKTTLKWPGNKYSSAAVWFKGRISESWAVSFHCEEHSEEMEGHGHSSFLGQKWRAKKNIRKAKDGEDGLTQPTDHHQRPTRSSCCIWCQCVLLNNTEDSAPGKAVRTGEWCRGSLFTPESVDWWLTDW